MSRLLRVLFAVQGEGRGHMTQALAIRQMLVAQGHTVCAALVGQSAQRKPADFFVEGLDAPVHTFESPNFAYHPDTHAVSLGRTIFTGGRNSPLYRANLQGIGEKIRRYRPDVILNFYEGMMGLFSMVHRPETPIIAVGHQYMFFHPTYEFAPGQNVSRAAMLAYTRLTCTGAKQLLALSLYEADDRRRIRVTPPVLRRELFDLDGSPDDGYLLAYLLHSHLADRLVRWHEKNRVQKIHCFWDGDFWQPHPNLTFHPLDGTRFLKMMARAHGVVCTAGFESVSEAMWLGKPVYMMPTPGHLEQRSNAIDAADNGAGIFGDDLDLNRFLDYLPTYQSRAESFRAWVAQAEPVVVDAVERNATRSFKGPIRSRLAA